MKEYYRLTESKKKEIAQNLIDFLEKYTILSSDAKTFIGNWIHSVRREKFKAYYDVWEIVLKNFMPKTRPILIRSIERKSKSEYIASFTNSAYCAHSFSRSFDKKCTHQLSNGESIELDGQGKGYWIICDTRQTTGIFENVYKKGDYKYTFFPLIEIIKKAKENGGWGFSDGLIEKGLQEDEYIMKIDFSNMILLRFIK